MRRCVMPAKRGIKRGPHGHTLPTRRANTLAPVQFKLRFREGLRRKIELAAKEHGISMNAEIAYRLEQSFSSEDLATTVAAKVVAAIKGE